MMAFFLAVGLFAAATAPVVAKVNENIERQREAERQLMKSQQRALDSLNLLIVHPPPSPQVVRQPTPTPIQQMSKRQVFGEIERIERQQRDLRRIGQDLPLSTVDYLEKLKTALDSGT